MLAQIVWAYALFHTVSALNPWPIIALRRIPRGWGVLGDLGAAGLALVLFNLTFMLIGAAGMR